MLRPQLTLRALLVAMLVVGAIYGGWWLVARPPSRTAAPEVVDLSENFKVRNLREVLKAALSGSSAITFLSSNGRWIGTDCDTEIKLMADGTAHLTEYGYGVDSYDGTYSINKDSELTLSFKGYAAGWPAMRVYRDDSMLLLAPAHGSPRFIHGQRAAAYLPPGAGSFWPFRQIVD